MSVLKRLTLNFGVIISNQILILLLCICYFGYCSANNCQSSKRQLISKGLFGVFNSSKKMNKNNSTRGIILIVLRSNFFLRFCKNWSYQKDISKLSDLYQWLKFSLPSQFLGVIFEWILVWVCWLFGYLKLLKLFLLSKLQDKMSSDLVFMMGPQAEIYI